MNLSNSLHRWIRIGSLVVGMLLVAQQFRLVEINRQLRNQIESYYQAIALPAGARLPSVAGLDDRGREMVLDSSQESKPVLVLVFSPSCPACDENWPRWRDLIAAQRAVAGRVLMVDITGRVRPDYLAAHDVATEPVMLKVSPETQVAYGFRFTPQTLILHRGALVAGWLGILREAQLTEAKQALAGPQG